MPNHRRRRSIAGAVAVAVSLGVVAPATDVSAGALGEHAARADQLLKDGKAHAALEAFDLATDTFWRTSPLQFRTVIFADDVAGFGKYTPRADARFRAGESVTVYLEPIGYGYIVDATGYRVALTSDLEIRTPGGLILAKADDFGDLTWEGRAKSREVHTSIVVALPDLKPGDYLIRLTLADRASTKSASVTMPFAIVE